MKIILGNHKKLIIKFELETRRQRRGLAGPHQLDADPEPTLFFVTDPNPSLSFVVDMDSQFSDVPVRHHV